MASQLVLVIAGLYLVTSEDGTRERSHIAVAGAALEGGARVVQFRDKRLSDADFADVAASIQALCFEAGATFVVNDRASVAMKLRAGALHLGQNDLAQLDEWRPTLPAVFGVSCNGPEHVPRALALGAGYIGCGPVYATSYEHSHKRVIGLDGLAGAVRISKVPVAAIGGIDATRIPAVVSCRPAAICVKSAIPDADDMVVAAKTLARLIEQEGIFDNSDEGHAL